MPTLRSEIFQESPYGPESGRGLLYFAYVFLVSLLFLALFGYWQFAERRDFLVDKFNTQTNQFLSRSDLLLELDKLLQRGVVLSNSAVSESLVNGFGEKARSGQAALFEHRLREAQRLLARSELRNWRAPEVAELIDKLHRLLELYLTMDPISASVAISPASDSQIMLSLLQDLHRAHVATGRQIELIVYSVQELEHYFYRVNLFLLVLGLVPLAIVIFYATSTQSALVRTRRHLLQGRLVFNAIPEMAVVLDGSGRIVRANRGVMTLLDYAPSSLEGQLFSSLLSAQFLPHFADFFQAVLSGTDRGGMARELVLICRTGSEVPVEVSGSSVAISGRSYLVLTVRDLREQQYLQNQLRISQRRFELAVAATRDGMWDWDLTTRRVFFSQSWRAMLGLSARELTNDDRAVLELVIPKEDLPSFRRKVRRFVRSDGMQFRFEHRLLHRDGRILTVICRASVERDSKGHIVRVVGTHSDITDIKRRERDAFAVNRQLENLLQNQADQSGQSSPSGDTQFLSVLGHEIRTPMNGLLGMTDMLIKTPLNAEQRMMADIIHESSGNLLSVLDDLIDFGALHSNTLTLDWQRVDLVALIDDILARYCRQSGNQHIFFYPAKNLPAVVIGDPARMSQIFGKLIDNALKFSRASKPRGVVKIWLEAEDIEQVGNACNLRFRVWDNGIGIPAEIRRNLFKPFAQGESGRGRRFGGSGLGLAICERLVKLLDGDISIDSEMGRFTEARVSLPLQWVPGVQAANQRPVLLQITNESLRDSVEAILAHGGYDVTVAQGESCQWSRAAPEVLLVTDTVDQGSPTARLLLVPRPRGEQKGAVGNQVFTNPLLPSALLGGLAALKTQLVEGQ